MANKTSENTSDTYFKYVVLVIFLIILGVYNSSNNFGLSQYFTNNDLKSKFLIFPIILEAGLFVRAYLQLSKYLLHLNNYSRAGTIIKLIIGANIAVSSTTLINLWDDQFKFNQLFVAVIYIIGAVAAIFYLVCYFIFLVKILKIKNDYSGLLRAFAISNFICSSLIFIMVSLLFCSFFLLSEDQIGELRNYYYIALIVMLILSYIPDCILARMFWRTGKMLKEAE